MVSSPCLIPDDPKYVPQAIYFGKNHKLKKNVINKESFLLTAGRCPVEKAFKFIFCNRFYRKLEAVYIAVKLASRNSCVFKERFKVG